jgi:cysteinyl-tRNA synthetase
VPVTLRLYDSASRDTRDFEPLVPTKVSMYLCGVTVQSPPHVGHMRSALVFDQLSRWMAHRGFAVTLIRNVTDIDDKVLVKSAELGMPWWEWGYLNEQACQRAYDVLNIARPAYEPRATGHVPEMIVLMQKLIARGHAYPAEDGSGDVYFDVRSWPDYGRLSRMKIDEMEPATDADPRGKRDPRDFALWKGAKEGEPSWPTPWGAGRPGWHLECSAMAGKYLGDAFDIHGGGIDLRFPHHENELAQSSAVGQRFANFWMHNAWVTTSGEKMSKSLGNSLLVDEVVKRVRPVELRYYLGSAHYRSHMEYSEEALGEAGTAYRRLEGFVTRATQLVREVEPAVVCADFEQAMDDDLGVPAALAALHDVVRDGNKLLAKGDSPALRGCLASVRAMLDVLGLDPMDPVWQGGPTQTDTRLREAVDVLVGAALDDRETARHNKDFAAADAVRDRLAAASIAIEDTPAGPRWTLEEAP